MRNTVLAALAAAVLVLAAAPAAQASWSFYGYDLGTEAWCFGEPRTGFDASCHIDTSGTTFAATNLHNGKCAASVGCGSIVKTCLASEWGGGTPGDKWEEPFCYAVSYPSSPTNSRAVCKSDLGWSVLRCE